MEKAVIIDGIRTPFGSFGGSLKDVAPTDLCTKVVKALLSKTELNHELVDEIIVGSVFQPDASSIYLARHIGLNAELPVHIPALNLNRLCGSGLEVIIQAAMRINMGFSKMVMTCGVENMSQAPYVAQGARWGNRMGGAELDDILHSGLYNSYNGIALGVTAENLAKEYSISREEQDEWAAQSQMRAEKARDNGRFAQEIIPVRVRTEAGRGNFEHDEFIRGRAGCEKLHDLPAAFVSDGTVTAGNSSGINDGASAMLVASESFAKEHGLKPSAKILGWASTGCDPSIMGIGPAIAAPTALKMAGLKLSDIDLVEINEAYAAQFLAVAKVLKLDRERTNVNGGAIALGHPLGASGNRLALTITRELQNRNARYGLVGLCVGGGQGIAMVIEAVR